MPRIIAGLRVGRAFSAIPVPDPPIIRGGASGIFHDKSLAGVSRHAVIPNVNTVDGLREIWPRLSNDERRLFDVIARSYLSAMMPDFRYRQTTVTLGVQTHPFRATGRQPIEHGWRAAFPDWQPAGETGEDAQLLPPLTHGETALLRDAAVEDKETRPPPRYNEGTLIDAMQTAWRFVVDEVLRERLKAAKGIGTPATRAEIIRGLKAQGFLIPNGKHIVPTERGLSLFAVLEQADPALVDPGVTAQMERLLDDVLVGQQEMTGAIDAVCARASRIISRLQAGADCGTGSPVSVWTADGADRPPTASIKRFIGSLAKQHGIQPPRGYTTSRAACRAFLDRHAPPGDGVRSSAEAASRLAPARAASDNGDSVVPPTDHDARSSVVSAKPDREVNRRKRNGGGTTGHARRPDKARTGAVSPDGHETDTPLRIPFDNKEVALQLGARYRSGGWYAPSSTDLACFRQRGWL